MGGRGGAMRTTELLRGRRVAQHKMQRLLLDSLGWASLSFEASDPHPSPGAVLSRAHLCDRPAVVSC